MRIRTLTGVAMTAILLSAAVPARLSSGQKKKTAGEKVREVLPEAEPVFTVHEQTILKNYFRDNRSGLPPGLAKRDHLPPELERRLSVLPTGYRRVVIAGNVILMNEKTSLIYDIVRNVIP